MCFPVSLPRHSAFSLGWMLAGVLALSVLAGCGKSPAARSEPAGRSADEVLRRMVQAYQSASAYQDQAVVRLRYQRSGRQYQDEAPLAVAWQAPGKLQVRAYETRLACDGEYLRARIRDASTRDFDGQVVERPLRVPLTLEQLCDEDRVLNVALRQGLAGLPLQLDLLLSDQPLAVFQDDQQVTRSLLDPQPIGPRACQRVRIESTDGVFVLWIDEQDHLLRRMEYPAATFAAEVAEDPSVEDLALTVEFREARFAAPENADQFTLAIAADAKRVRQFIPPPRQLPSELFGKQVAAYSFRRAGGGVVTSQDLADKIKVLVWFNDHPACQAAVQQLDQVYQQYAAQNSVAFLAVCAEPGSFGDEQLRELMRLWQVQVPVARDVQAYGRDRFRIPWAPTMVVLDGRDTVHIFEVGLNPNLVVELPQVLERLLAGDDLAAEIRHQFQAQQDRYAEALRHGAPLPDAAADDGLPGESRPRALRLRPLWSNETVESPGNIVAIDGPSPTTTHYLVLEGWRTVSELDARGVRIARHELDLPKLGAVSQLRTTLDQAGNRLYLAWSLQGKQVHLFDHNWQRLLSYPAPAATAEGVQDAVLLDLDADGQLELVVGFWGETGVEAVTLRGQPIWNCREVSHVTSLAPMAAARLEASPDAPDEPAGKRHMWVASASGLLVALGYDGEMGRPVTGRGQLIHLLYHQPVAANDAPPLCGISYGADGRRLANGLSAELESRWRYSLPAGSFPTEIRFVTAGPILDAEQPDWVIAGTDGSIHVVRADGRFRDHFHTGQAVRGLAVGRDGETRTLVVAAADQLRAWRVLPPSTAAK